MGLLASGGVGVPFPVLLVSSGGFPAWGHFDNLGLGMDCFLPGELFPALLVGSTIYIYIVLDGVV